MAVKASAETIREMKKQIAQTIKDISESIRESKAVSVQLVPGTMLKPQSLICSCRK